MKICIVTVFKSENCGSFLQAWALQEQLSRMGNDVCFLDYRGGFDNFFKKIDRIVRCCLCLRFNRAKNFAKKSFDFKRLQKSLDVICLKKTDVDFYVFGSDTLWNFDDAFFSKKAHFFTGANVDKPCYTYAISIGSTTRETFCKNDNVVKNIQKFQMISVRDLYTERIISDICPSVRIMRTVDPTLLFDKEKYIKYFFNKSWCHEKCLVVYYFGTIPDSLWRELKIFARKKGLVIVNVGSYEKQFDFSVVASPANFITAFANAEYVFTNTFHGCVFSTLFNKQFATDGMHKNKIERFLNEFSLLNRCVSNPGDVERVLTDLIDYRCVNALIKERREQSISYLQRVMIEVKEHEWRTESTKI